MTPNEKYQAEIAQSEIDHHTPTAGAMTGHVLANLAIQQTKLKQAAFYGQGQTAKADFRALALKEAQLFDELAELMLDEGEVIPTTTEEFTRYTMLQESGETKYQPTATLQANLVADLDTQNMFITRAIKLAKKEDKFPLAHFLTELYSFNQRQIRLLQEALHRDLWEGREE